MPISTENFFYHYKGCSYYYTHVKESTLSCLFCIDAQAWNKLDWLSTPFEFINLLLDLFQCILWFLGLTTRLRKWKRRGIRQREYGGALASFLIYGGIRNREIKLTTLWRRHAECFTENSSMRTVAIRTDYSRWQSGREIQFPPFKDKVAQSHERCSSENELTTRDTVDPFGS